MTAAAAPASRLTIPGIAPLLLLYGWLALDQLLLWRFLGFGGWAVLLVGGAALTAIGGMIALCGSSLPRIPLGRIALLFGLALLLCALGGQGKLFYANIDWQVREAVLRDLAVNPWPFTMPRRLARWRCCARRSACFCFLRNCGKSADRWPVISRCCCRMRRC